MTINTIFNIAKTTLAFIFGFIFVKYRQEKKEKELIKAQLNSIKEYEKRKKIRDALSDTVVDEQLQQFVRKEDRQ